MRIFRYRPLSLGCFLFLLCLFFAYFLGNIFAIGLIIAGTLALACFFAWRIFKNTKRANAWLSRALPSCLCLILCGVVALCSFVKDEKISRELLENESVERVLITEICYSTNEEIVAIGKTDRTEIIVSLPIGDNKHEKISVGDTVHATLSYHELQDSLIGFSEHDYYLDKGIFLCADVEKYEKISSQRLFWQELFDGVNSFLDKILEKSLNNDTYSLASAMLLGNRNSLDGSVRRDFSRLGITHILALSGIHISLITALLSVGLDALNLRRSVKYASLVGLIMFFICITGFAESAIRAGLMLILFYILSYIGFESDRVTNLFVAVVLICAFDPYAIFSTSLMLSFTAMLGCFCSLRYTKKVRALYKIRPKFIRGIVYSLISSVVVVLFTLPIMCIKFRYVSIFTPIFNILFVPLLSLLLYMAPFVLLVGWIPYISYIITIPAELISRLSLYLVASIARLDFLTISFTSIGQYIGVGVIFVAVILALALSKRQIKQIAVILATGLAIFGASSVVIAISRENTVAISTYDAAFRDLVAVESENEVMIIEMSRPSKSSASESGAYAQWLGYTDIDTYVLTDYSDKIVDAIDSISSSVLVRKILLPAPSNQQEKALFEMASAYARENDIKLEKIPAKYNFGATSVDFATILPSKANEKRSVIFKITSNNSSTAYLGAGTHDLFDDTPSNYVKNADVVIFGAYGNKYYSNLTYDFSNASYIVLNGESEKYLPEIPDNVSIKPNMHRFIFK